jgi:hypothetical protein
VTNIGFLLQNSMILLRSTEKSHNTKAEEEKRGQAKKLNDDDQHGEGEEIRAAMTVVGRRNVLKIWLPTSGLKKDSLKEINEHFMIK